MHEFRDVIPATANVTTLAVETASISILVLDEMVIEDLAIFFIGTNLSATHSIRFDGVRGFMVFTTRHPVADIQIMDVLLTNMIAAQPVVVVPVQDLVFHFRLALLTCFSWVPDTTAVPIRTHRHDVPDGTVFDPLNGFQIARLMVSLQTDTDFQLLFSGQFVGFDDLTHPGGIDGNRLFHEDVLPCLDRIFKVNRAKTGRRGEDDQIDTTIDHFLISIQSIKNVLGFHLYPVTFCAKSPFDRIDDAASIFRKGVANSGQLNIAVGGKCLSCRARSTASASNQTDFDGIVSASK